MNIWLLKDNKKEGPHHDFEVRSMITNKEIEPETLVWHEGMVKWEPIGSLPLFEDSFHEKEEESGQEDEPADTEVVPERVPEVNSGNVKAYLEDLAQKEEREPHVPARKYTAEGEPVTTLYDGAQGVFLWRRMFARILDIALLGFILYLTSIFAHREFAPFITEQGNLVFVLSFVTLYETFCIHLFGSSVGKAILGIRIESRSGPNIGLFRAFLRGLVIASTYIFLFSPFFPILFILCLFFAKKRGILPWDVYGNSRARALPMTRTRVIGALLFLISLIIILSLVTPTQFYNQLFDSIEQLSGDLKKEP